MKESQPKEKKERVNIKDLSGQKLSDLCVEIRLKHMDLANEILKEFLKKRGESNDETKQKI